MTKNGPAEKTAEQGACEQAFPTAVVIPKVECDGKNYDEAHDLKAILPLTNGFTRSNLLGP